MTRVVEHPASINPFTRKVMGDAKVEYFLPVDRNRIPEGFELPFAFNVIADLDGKAATREWGLRFKDCKSTSVAAFAELVQTFGARSLILFDKTWVLRCGLGDDDSALYPSFYHRVPLPEATLDASAKALGDFDQSLREFLGLFAGLSSTMPGITEGFAYSDCEMFADNPWIEHADEEAVTEWAESYRFYDLPNGDFLLLQREGRTAWYSHETGDVEPFTDSFENMLSKYVEAHQNGTSFDAI